MATSQPKVSIMLITYNHEKYVAQALESILSQKTDYSYNINVVEDCSTDRTQEVVMRYVTAYPGIVVPYFNTRNIGYKITQNNFYRGFKTLSGEYFAILEGDDYWTSPTKLQKQVEFLESNPDFCMCAHNTVKIYEGDRFQPHRFLYSGHRQDGTIEDVIYLRSFFHTTGVMYRNVFKGIPPRHYRSKWSCDIFIMISHAQFGKVHHLDEDMAVYRAHSGGRFSNMPLLDGWFFNVDGLMRYNGWLEYRYLKAFSGSIRAYSRAILTQSGKDEIAALNWYQRLKYCYIWLLYSAIFRVLDLPHTITVVLPRIVMTLRHTLQKHGQVESGNSRSGAAETIIRYLRSTTLHLLKSLFPRQASKSALKILSFAPKYATHGQPFNVQPSGRSAIWLTLDGEAAADAAIVFAGTALTSTVVQGLVVTANVPSRLVAKAGLKPVWLESRAGRAVESTEPIFLEVR